VYVDLATVRDTIADIDEDVDIDALPWPDPGEWVARLRASPLVTVEGAGPGDRPLRLAGSALYLDRYWQDETAVAADLIARLEGDQPAVDEATLSRGLARLFGDDLTGEQRWAAAVAVLRRLSVIAGGPGTGKTTTVARVLVLLEEQAMASGDRPPLVGLAAPTGKAAARMEEAVRAEAQRINVEDAIRDRLLSVSASTLHRLLGTRPDSSSRFRHYRHNRLPHDVLIVDETSMVSLSLMSRFIEAVRAEARLILLGDPEQLSSVEAGAVLGDIVGPVQDGLLTPTDAERARMGRVTAAPFGAAASVPHIESDRRTPIAAGRLGDGIVVLRTNYRFRGPLAQLAAAIRSGDAEETVAILGSGQPGIRWVAVDVSEEQAMLGNAGALQPVRTAVVDAGRAMLSAAATANGEAALAALGRFRVLCAHRKGRASVSLWTQRVEDWLAEEVEGFSASRTWYLGRPVIVTANDYGLRLFNGDTGVVVARTGGGIDVVFRRGRSLVGVSPSRLPALETAFAMTVHKAQGSEFQEVAILLPASSSPILTRQLFYTAVTRAQEGIIVAGSEEAVRTAVLRPVARASGLTRRLWPSAAT
jgi:exodeoxyribonuclease V alpha subunit